MADKIAEKCRLCAKLTAAQAQALHGEEGTAGDKCWDKEKCHKRRSHYKNRETRNYARRLKRQAAAKQAKTQGVEVVVLDLPTIAVPFAVLHYYRRTKDSPLHALGGEFWVGNERIARATPVHCVGLSNTAVMTVATRMLRGFSDVYGQKIERFRDEIELDPQQCPIRPCHLIPDSQ